MIDPHSTTLLSAVLFCLGILGVFVRRNVISVLLSLELMLSAAVLALVSFDSTSAAIGSTVDPTAGQGLAVLVLTLVTAQTIVGLGLLIAARRTGAPLDPEHAGTAQW